MYCTFDVLYYLRLLFGIACLAYHTAIKFALYQPLYPEFIVNSFAIKRAAATLCNLLAHSMANIKNTMPTHFLINMESLHKEHNATSLSHQRRVSAQGTLCQLTHSSR